MALKFFNLFAQKLKGRRNSRLPKDIIQLSPHMRADIGYPVPDRINTLRDYPYNFRV